MTYHSFKSITEEQWKSGFNRHHCAFCSRDYSDPVHCKSSWPLVVVIEDCYVPNSARDLLSALQGLDDESCRVSIQLYALDAAEEIERYKN